MISIEDLPAPPEGKTGWPWTLTGDHGARPPAVRTGVDARPWPRISIITPTLNQGAFIEETIRAVLLQQYPDLELIVIDGGSTDATLSLLERYSPWLTFWSSAPDGGQADAINKGLDHATGEIFAWCNSDDCYLPNALERVASAFLAHDCIFVAAPVVDVGLRHSRIIGSACLDFANLVEFWTTERSIMRDQGLFYPRSVLAEAGRLDTSLHYAFDYDFLIRVARHRAAHYLTEPVSTFRYHQESKTIRVPHRWLDEILGVSQRYWNLVPGLDPLACDRFMAGARLRRGVGELLRAPRIALALIAKALAAHPAAAIVSSIRYTLRRAGLDIPYEEPPPRR